MQTRRFITVVCSGLAALLILAGAAHAQPTGAPPAPAATFDAILKALATYNGGIDSGAAWQLREYVAARAGDPAALAACESQMLTFLTSPATPSAKAAVARQLRLMAGDTALPALQAMAADPRFADYATYVLQPMPGAGADAALLKALAAAKGAARTAVIVALGDRRTADATPALVALLAQPDVAVAAATALGRIATPAAIEALRQAATRATGNLKPTVAGALLVAADARLAANDAAAAAAIYDAVAALSTPAAPLSDAARRAIAIGRIRSAGERAPAVLLDLLKGGDALGRDAAVARLAEVFGPDAIGPVCDALPALPEAAQVQVLAALRAYPASRIAPTVDTMMQAPSPDVRAAALRTFAAYGGAVPGAAQRLVGLAARARGAEQAAARWALANLKGAAVDAELAGMLRASADEPALLETLQAVTERRLFFARAAVADMLMSSTARPVRVQALRSLRVLGTPSDVSAVLDVLIQADDDGERLDAEKTIAALAGMVANPEARARLVRGRPGPPSSTPAQPPAARARILGVLPLLGDNSALPMIRAALADTNADIVDAAVRALAEWPTAAARDDLRAVAKGAAVDTHRLLALQGLIRVIALEAYRKPEAAVADLKEALGLATRAEERKLVLGALPTFACSEALAVATSLTADPEVQAEAKAAVERMNTRQPRF